MKDLNSANDELRNQIQSQQMAQQQVVLLKDRLEKIKKVYLKPNANKSLTALDPMINSLPLGVTVSELSIDTEKTSLLLTFLRTSDLAIFLDGLDNETNFTSIVMDSFDYSPKEGYSVGLSFIPKIK